MKKIVKVQAMMRRFIARKRLYKKIKKYQVDYGKSETNNSEFSDQSTKDINNIVKEPNEEYSESE